MCCNLLPKTGGIPDEGWAGEENGAMSHFYEGEWHEFGQLTERTLTCSSFANQDYGMMAGNGVRMFYIDGDWYVYETGSYYIDCFAIDEENFVAVTEG